MSVFQAAAGVTIGPLLYMGLIGGVMPSGMAMICGAWLVVIGTKLS